MKHQSDTLTYIGRTLMPQLSLITVLGLKRREVRLFLNTVTVCLLEVAEIAFNVVVFL